MKKLLLGFMIAAAIVCIGFLGVPRLSNADTKEEVIEMKLTTGKLRIQVCTQDIIRVRYSPNGMFEEKTINTFAVKNQWDEVKYDVTEDENKIVIVTEKLQVQFDKARESVKFSDAAGNVLLTEGIREFAQVPLEDKIYYSISQNFISPASEYLYGFGNVNDAVGIRNTTISIEQNNVRKRTPMFFSNMGYGILFDVISNGSLTWPAGNSEYRYTGNCTDSMDYYFFYGPEADQIISGYRNVTGQAIMLPKNSFGYVQSRNRYGSQEELLSIVNTFRTKGIPLDTIVIDYYWWNGEFNNILEWSRDWPNPAEMMKKLHEKNVTASISIWPSFRAGTKTYDTIFQAGHLFTTPSNFGFNYDPTTKAGRNFYWNMILDSVWSKGLDSVWLDACEPETSNFVSNSTGEPTASGFNSRVIGTMYPLLTTQGVYEGQRALEGNEKRVNTLSRGAVAGIQRYGIQSWSGDIAANWNQYRQEIAGVINYSAAGLPYFSTDTGGYFGIDVNDPKDREMFLRWLQFSTFNSIMRVHGADCVKEPWQFGSQYEAYITDYINLRERLIPYIYSLAGQVTQEAGTMVRAMVFDFREDPKVATIQDQFMFGPAFMVCPITVEGAQEREVYFPKGTWINFWTGEVFLSNGETKTVAAPLKQIPLFVRGGSIVPMGPFIQYATEACDPMELRIYMGADGSFQLYEDEGDNYNYENGAFSNIPFTWNEKEHKLTIGDRTGSFDGMKNDRTFQIVFVQQNYGFGIDVSEEYQATVSYDGTKQSVIYDPNWEAPLPKLDPDRLPVPAAIPTALHSDKALIGEWSFDEGEGARIKDNSGNFNHGSLVTAASGVWDTNGKKNSAINFTGGSAGSLGTFVEVNNNASLQMTEEISFSAWVNFTGSGHANILNKGGNGTNNPGFSFILLNGSLLQLEIQSAKNESGSTQKTTAVSTGVFQTKAWHQVGFTWKSEAKGGDGIVRIYVDGIQTSSDSYAGNYFKGPIGLNSSNLRLGCSDVTEPNYPNYFKGLLDEVKLFNYELTKDEMVRLSKEESIVIPNVEEIHLKPGDKQITVSWNETLSKLSGIKIRCVGVDTEYNKEFTVLPGVKNYSITGLQNGKYYYITVITVMEDGKESQGVNLVGIASDVPVTLSCLYTHDGIIYGYGRNLSEEEITGNLIVKVYSNQEGSITLQNTYEQELSIAAADMKQFMIDIGEYVENQFVQIQLVKGETVLSKSKSLKREQLYKEFNSLEELKKEIKNLLDQNVTAEWFTNISLEDFEQVKTSAKKFLEDQAATQEYGIQILNDLKTTLDIKSTSNDESPEELEESSATMNEADESKAKNTSLPVVFSAIALGILIIVAGIVFVIKRKARN
ncbi:MAG: Alpha-glucosidase [Herbinix sp.]|jgi:alpha-D-xyloside xylohydrolase|nr:Alpha-glucosidase [Herbinix sp.]